MGNLKDMSQDIVNTLKAGIDSNDFDFIHKGVVQILNDFKPVKNDKSNVDKVIKKYSNKITYFDTNDVLGDIDSYLEDLNQEIENYLDFGDNTVNEIKASCKAVVKGIETIQKQANKLNETKNKISSFMKELEAAQKKDNQTKQNKKK